MPLARALAVEGTTTTTEEVPRIVGEPLEAWVVVAAGVAILLVILVAGLLVRRRTQPRR
jgi:hypothetical protein